VECVEKAKPRTIPHSGIGARGKLLSIEEIHEKVWRIVEGVLKK